MQAVVRAEVENDGEAALDGRQPLHEIIRNARQQEIVTSGTRRGSVAAPDQQPAVEDVEVGGHRLRRLCSLGGPADKTNHVELAHRLLAYRANTTEAFCGLMDRLCDPAFVLPVPSSRLLGSRTIVVDTLSRGCKRGPKHGS